MKTAEEILKSHAGMTDEQIKRDSFYYSKSAMLSAMEEYACQKNQIIKRLMLELDCAITVASSCEGVTCTDLEDAELFLLQLAAVGYPAYPQYINQTDEQKREIIELRKLNVTWQAKTQ